MRHFNHRSGLRLHQMMTLPFILLYGTSFGIAQNSKIPNT